MKRSDLSVCDADKKLVFEKPNITKSRQFLSVYFRINVDNTINVSVDFEWEGISVENKPMIAETHHEWILENNLDERFARMKMMKVIQTKPFQTVE